MKKYIYFLFVFLLFACGNKNEDTVVIPEGVFSKEKMTAVLVDVHLLEATMGLNITAPGNVGFNFNATPLIDILKKHNITQRQYIDSYFFYTQHPQLLNEVYQEVLNELSKMQAEATNEK